MGSDKELRWPAEQAGGHKQSVRKESLQFATEV